MEFAVIFPTVFDITAGQFHLIREMAPALNAGIWAAIVAGIGGAIATGLNLVGLTALRRPARLLLRLDWSFLRRFLIGVVTGVTVVLPLVVVYELPLALIEGSVNAAIAVVIGIPVGLGFGLIFGLMGPSEQPPTPASSLGSNRLVSIITLLVATLSFVLVWGPLLFGVVTIRPPARLALILRDAAFGLEGGLPIALGFAAVLPWSAYQLAHLWLALRGRLPWRLFAFLADAHERGVLRQVGGVYQFRHARLQDRLGGP